jgi:hypothetical protein
MPSSIVARLISGINSDKKLILSNSYCARAMEIGTGWEKLRLGIRYSISGSGNVTLNPIFTFGICSGTGFSFGDSVTRQFLGVQFSGNDFWFYTGTNGGHLSSSVQFVSRTGGLTTIRGAVNSQLPYYHSSCNTTGDIRAMYLDLWKNEGAFGRIYSRFYWFAIQENTPFIPTGRMVDSGAFLRAMEVTQDAQMQSFVGPIEVSDFGLIDVPTFDSGKFYGDTVCLFWNKTSHQIEISDIAYAKHA